MSIYWRLGICDNHNEIGWYWPNDTSGIKETSAQGSYVGYKINEKRSCLGIWNMD